MTYLRNSCEKLILFFPGFYIFLMISIAFYQISTDLFQSKEKTQTMCRNTAVIYNLNLIITSYYPTVFVIIQKTQKNNYSSSTNGL